VPEEVLNGSVIVDKEKRTLYRRKGGRWVKVEEERLELVNGEELAVCLNKDLEADIYFKVSYKFK